METASKEKVYTPKKGDLLILEGRCVRVTSDGLILIKPDEIGVIGAYFTVEDAKCPPQQAADEK